MNPAVAQIQEQLVEIRTRIVATLQALAGDRELSGKTATATDKLELLRAEEALAEARIDLARIEMGE